MAFLSRLYGAQINKAGLLAAHQGAGTILTFDSSLVFPTPEMLASKGVESGVLKPDEYYYAGATSLMQKFDYKDSSTLNIYVDSSSNIMYRWKHYTFEEWKKTHWDQDEDGNYIEPVEPKREDYDTDEEYDEALLDYNNSIYPTSDVADASRGWTYVPCAGGGSGSDLYWEEI